MKINSLDHIMNVYNNQKRVTGGTKKTEIKKDELLLSNEAKDIQYAYKLVRQAPDIRKEKVQQLKNQIKTGTYNVNLEEVAEKIVSSIDLKG